MNYKKSGVNIKAGDRLVQWLLSQGAKHRAVSRKRVVKGIGGFSALFSAGFKGMRNPCLVAATDGVGTKLKLASYFQSYQEVGQDLVAMCANDVLCVGAEPLFFMDYYSCGRLQQKPAREFLTGVLKACEKAGYVLLGGETAEMPGCYKPSDWDCAGFALGVVERSKRLGSAKVRAGDVLVGVSSLGFHSNGFSLLRKVFSRDLKKWKKELLKPTALYPTLARHLFRLRGLRALAHITGGGMDNILRILPPGVKAALKPWPVPPPFQEVKKRAGLSWSEMLRTFNCGVGLVAVVSPHHLPPFYHRIEKEGFSFFELGTVVPLKKKCTPPSWSLSFSKKAGGLRRCGL